MRRRVTVLVLTFAMVLSLFAMECYGATPASLSQGNVVATGLDQIAVIDQDNNLMVSTEGTTVKKLSDVVSVSSCYLQSRTLWAAVKEDGSLWTWDEYDLMLGMVSDEEAANLARSAADLVDFS